MDLSFYPLTLEALDQAEAESLCIFVSEDQRPLRGLAGLVDWRLVGALSRYVRSGFLTGKSGDALLTIPGPRLGFQKLFLLGMGPSGQSEEELSQRILEGLVKLAAAGVSVAGFDLPSGVSVEAGVRTLLDAREAPSKALVFGPDPSALVSALSQAAAAARGAAAPVVERRVVKVPSRPAPPPPRPILTPPAVKPLPGQEPQGTKKRK